MSAPTSGSSGSSSAGSPAPGYYPDPSIPHYIRYWDGSSWVPGTSRPAPAEGGPAAVSRVPAIDESGPMYLDEDPSAPTADQGAPADPGPGPAAADPRAQSPAWPAPRPAPRPAAELPPLSWRSPAPDAQHPSPAQPVQPWSSAPPSDGPQLDGPQGGFRGTGQQAPRPVPPQPVPPRPMPPQPMPAQPVPPQPVPPQSAQPRPEVRGGQPFGPPPAAQPLPGQAGPSAGQAAGTPWAAQVQDLARGESVVPWRPVANDPFGASQGHDRPGGLLRRFAARVIDTVLLGALTAVAAVPLGTAAYHHTKDKVDQARLTGEAVRVWLIDGTTGVQLGVVLAVFLVAGLLVEVLPTAKWGRTPGKKLAGLRVLDIEAQLPPGFGTSLRRWLTRTVLDLLAVGVVSAAWCLFDRPWKQCWHDKAARTFVAGV